MIWTIILVFVVTYFLLDRLIRVFKVGNSDRKHIFITGCDTGFGRELVTRLDKMGFPVFAACYTEDGRQSLTETCSSRVLAIPFDVTSEDSIVTAFNTVKQKLPDEKGLWAIVNNAGVPGQIVAAEMCSRKDHQDCYDVNLLGPIEVSRIFLPLLRKSRGRIVNVTSAYGRCAAGPAPYCVSKFGLEAYSDVLRREVSQFGVKVSIVEPGFMRTNLIRLEEMHKGIRDAYDRADHEVQAAYGKDYVELASIGVEVMSDGCSPNIYKVVDALVGALTSVYPRPRYVVGYDAKFSFIPLSFMPEWITDWFLLTNTTYMIRKKRAALK